MKRMVARLMRLRLGGENFPISAAISTSAAASMSSVQGEA